MPDPQFPVASRSPFNEPPDVKALGGAALAAFDRGRCRPSRPLSDVYEALARRVRKGR